MNILHISPYFPSTKANHAGGVCMGKEIETLQKWHQVYVLTFEASEFDAGLKKEYAGDGHYHSVKINKFTRMVHVALEPWMPNYFAARSSFRFAWKLICLVKKYKIHAIHAEYASMGQYLWIRRLFPDLKFNITEHDMTAQSYERKVGDSHGLKKVYLGFQLNRVLKKEGKYCRKADRVFTFNQKDKRLIEEKYHVQNCQVLNPYYGIEDDVIGNDVAENEAAEDQVTGNQVAESRMTKSKGIKAADPETGTQPYTLCFLGQMGRDENYQAAMRLITIAERVKKQIPQLQIYIVGNRPPEKLKQKENQWIHVTGFVEDVDIYLKTAALAVFPLTLGAGIKLKVLRSLALGTAVITGKVGTEGIDEDYQVIIPAETDEEYEKQIIKYLNDPEKRSVRAMESRNYIKEHFSWKTSERILAQVYGDGKQ